MSFVSGLTLGLFLAALALALRRHLASFRAQRPADYDGAGPAFDLRRHLSGPLTLEGVLYGPTGRVTSRFTADAFGTWQGDTGTLREVFHYDSGRSQSREWQLQLLPNGQIRATAGDVVGTGYGVARGSAMKMRYRFRLPADVGGHVLSVTDWMYLAPNGHILNRSQFTKFGLTVAELIATIRPAAAQSEAAQPPRVAAE